jgi:putative phosphoesterase
VRLGLIADVHCNVEAFARALEELDGEVDEVLLLGDLVYEYRLCNETISMAREGGFRYVLGNHELGVLSPASPRARTREGVDPANVEYLYSLPTRHDIATGGKRVCMVHASPFPPFNEYLYPGSPMLRQCADLDVEFLVLGHTHVAMAERHGGTLVINPGSLGESRDPGSPEVSYAILDTENEEVELHRFPNPMFGPSGPTTVHALTEGWRSRR